MTVSLETFVTLMLNWAILLNCAAQSQNDMNPSASKSSQHTPMAVSLTFQKGDAEQAMNFYTGLFEDAEVLSVQRWPEASPGEEGQIMTAQFSINGMLFICSDSPPVHDWDFSPAVSVHINCQSEEEIERLYKAFAEKGTPAMPLDNYGFSKKFAWVIDQFGLSWQLTLP